MLLHYTPYIINIITVYISCFSSNLDFSHLLQNTPNISGIHPDTL